MKKYKSISRAFKRGHINRNDMIDQIFKNKPKKDIKIKNKWQ